MQNAGFINLNAEKKNLNAEKTNIQSITDEFRNRFLNPSKSSTAVLFQQKQLVGENVQD